MAKETTPDEDAAAIPAPGSDPDSRQRLAKHLEAAGLAPDELPEGVSSAPIADEDRDAAAAVHTDAARAAEARSQAAEDAAAKAETDEAKAKAKADATATPPQGRSATGPKAATTT